jgi:hypothetical protein
MNLFYNGFLVRSIQLLKEIIMGNSVEEGKHWAIGKVFKLKLHSYNTPKIRCVVDRAGGTCLECAFLSRSASCVQTQEIIGNCIEGTFHYEPA